MTHKMLTLGIETSCDETSVSVTRGRRVLSNAVTSSLSLHKKYGGVVPEIASRYHVEYIMEVLSKALAKSGFELEDMGLVAVTNGPGLVGALLIGISIAKSISYSLRLPLIGVNHVLAHLYSAFLSEGSVPQFPFVGLVVSGGHTALFYCERVGRQTLLGQTQDDAAGEAFDKVAKLLGLGYPGGPVIEKTARLSRGARNIVFPKANLGKDSLDFSFSGVKTAVLYYVRDRQSREYRVESREKKNRAESTEKKNPKLAKSAVADVCYAFQEAVVDALVEKACLAAELHNAGTLVVGGGVAANSRLREKFMDAGKKRGLRVYFPELAYCLDNAAMVGFLGEELYKKGRRSSLYLSAEPNLEVRVC